MTFDELLQTVPAEVKAAIEQIENKAGTSDADWQFIKAAGELLAAAKAASRCPARVENIYDTEYPSDCYIECWNGDECLKFREWLYDRMKERGEG